MLRPEATARLEARFGCAGEKTRLSAYFGAAPLKIAKTFDWESGLGVCVMDCSPGMLAGDFYVFDWHLEAGARVFATTQGFTRVHPCRQSPCRLEQRFQLERGAVFEWFPEPLVLFQSAALRLECEVEIAPGATLLMGEIVAAGRIGRGEAFAFHALQNRLRVRREGRLIFVSQTALRPNHFAPQRVGAWGDFSHQGTFHVFSERADAALVEVLRGVLELHPPIWGGASLLEQGGVVVSLLGRRAFDLQEAMKQLRETARRHCI